MPKIDSPGERYREKQLSYQLPKQDLALAYCKHVEHQNKASYEDFVAGRNELALDIAYVKDSPNTTTCVKCDEKIVLGDMAVIAPKFRDQVSFLHSLPFTSLTTTHSIVSLLFSQMLWHPKCFTCSTCDELLVDLTYCVHDDKIYCERHYAELLKPRCNACDEVRTIL